MGQEHRGEYINKGCMGEDHQDMAETMSGFHDMNLNLSAHGQAMFSKQLQMASSIYLGPLKSEQ